MFFVDDDAEAAANKHFLAPPYSVESFRGNGGDGWHCVCNVHGINVLTFPDHPGRVFTTLENAERIAKEWNSGV